MDAGQSGKQRKALRRNIESLVEKCEKYSKLGGCEVALYVSYDDGGFISYESTELNWRQDIQAKRARAQQSVYFPKHKLKSIGHKVTGFYCKQKRGRVSGQDVASKPGEPAVPLQRSTRSLARRQAARQARRRLLLALALPALPDLTITSLRGCGAKRALPGGPAYTITPGKLLET